MKISQPYEQYRVNNVIYHLPASAYGFLFATKYTVKSAESRPTCSLWKTCVAVEIRKRWEKLSGNGRDSTTQRKPKKRKWRGRKYLTKENDRAKRSGRKEEEKSREEKRREEKTKGDVGGEWRAYIEKIFTKKMLAFYRLSLPSFFPFTRDWCLLDSRVSVRK